MFTLIHIATTSKRMISLNSLWGNCITDNGIQILSEHLQGNLHLETLEIQSNSRITDASIPYVAEIAKRSCVKEINLADTSISEEKKEAISKLLRIPHEEREIPINSSSKSAAKCS